MKSGKRPTREQKKLLEGAKLKPEDWLIVKNTPAEMVVVNRWSDRTVKTIRRERG